MLYIKDEGIIITKKPYKEKDAIVTILTKKYGKIRARATGLRRQESRILGLSEPGTIARFYFVASSGKSIVVSNNIVRLLSILSWKMPGEGFKKYPYLFLWSLRFLATLNIFEISDNLWKLILELDKKILKSPSGFHLWFALRVLDELGEMPNFEYCEKCGLKFANSIQSSRSVRSSGEPPLNSRPATPPLAETKLAGLRGVPSWNFRTSTLIFFHNSNLYCQNCKKPSYEAISTKDFELIKKIIRSENPIFPYPIALKKIMHSYLSTHMHKNCPY